MSDSGRYHDDPGLQPERTSLAWGRTIVSYLVVAAVLLRWMPYFGPVIGFIVMASAATGLVMLIRQRHRYQRLARGLHGERYSADATSVVALTGITVWLAVFACLIILFAE